LQKVSSSHDIKEILPHYIFSGEVQNFVGLHPVKADRKEEESEIRKGTTRERPF
jgi:hypothetical protein